MGYTATQLVKIAEAEIGYHEKASNANLDSKTANSGKGNYTKYSRDLHKTGYYNGNKQGFDWCDQFVDWCFFKLCGSKDKAEYLECQTVHQSRHENLVLDDFPPSVKSQISGDNSGFCVSPQ